MTNRHDGNKSIVGTMNLYLETKVIIALFTATKEMENPEDTAEKVGISALIVQVNWVYYSNIQLLHVSIYDLSKQ